MSLANNMEAIQPKQSELRTQNAVESFVQLVLDIEWVTTETQHKQPVNRSDCDGSFMPYDDCGRYWD